MLEGHTHRASFGEPRENAHLRSFRWTDLVARLAASRELRGELQRQEDGDFHAFTTVRRASEEGKPAINHDDLSDRKGTVVTLGIAAGNAVHGDREKE